MERLYWNILCALIPIIFVFSSTVYVLANFKLDVWSAGTGIQTITTYCSLCAVFTIGISIYAKQSIQFFFTRKYKESIIFSNFNDFSLERKLLFVEITPETVSQISDEPSDSLKH